MGRTLAYMLPSHWVQSKGNKVRWRVGGVEAIKSLHCFLVLNHFRSLVCHPASETWLRPIDMGLYKPLNSMGLKQKRRWKKARDGPSFPRLKIILEAFKPMKKNNEMSKIASPMTPTSFTKHSEGLLPASPTLTSNLCRTNLHWTQYCISTSGRARFCHYFNKAIWSRYRHRAISMW